LYESLIASVLEQSTPLVLAALAAMITLRANILNVAVEGMMLVSAFCSIAVGSITGSALAGFSAGICGAVSTSLVFSVITLRFGAGFIVAGLGINLLAAGGTLFVLERWYNSPGGLRPLSFPEIWHVPEGSLSFLPFLGSVLEGQSIIVLLTFLAVPACWVFLYRMPTGSYLRAVGEDEYAARSAGISVLRMKALAVTVSGLLSGLAGAQLAMDKLHFFLPSMTSGRGFIGLAATLFGAGHPWATSAAAVLFGFFGALGDRLQAFDIPSQFVLMLPYLVAIIALTFARWRIYLRNKPVKL
jgi:simple sugar transport system permease protein